ncbi:DMT family transporter [Falsihalocynthiibacter sp. S25ZX9]|uniref:DMT family transporter n=1 Tax=Falsihalocynthiibacter sp. S25ZX9 TaxID=3240870 RepID=UPI0035104FD5
MRLLFLVALAMVAFAANSVLNRLALAQMAIDPAGFAAVRLLSGGVFLWVVVLIRGRKLESGGVGGVVSLAVYMVGFSFAYITLGTGVGALILFGGVQITMFVGAILARESLPNARWIGAAVAFAGLVYLLWPSDEATVQISFSGAAMMSAAAIGWGIYSLIGRHAIDPLATTAGNFVFAIPLSLLVVLLNASTAAYTPTGIALAIISGVVTSGMGYAVWYAVLPKLPSTVAAISMLTVPIIASIGGVLILNEPLTVRLMVATALVLAGVLISLKRPSAG